MLSFVPLSAGGESAAPKAIPLSCPLCVPRLVNSGLEGSGVASLGAALPREDGSVVVGPGDAEGFAPLQGKPGRLMLDGGADAQLPTVYHGFSPIPDPMLRSSSSLIRATPRSQNCRGARSFVIRSEVLKACSSDALACSRNFLEFRMIEAKMGLESQKGALIW